MYEGGGRSRSSRDSSKTGFRLDGQPHHLSALVSRAAWLVAFEWVLARGQKQHLVELELPGNLLRGDKVTVMRRVEGAAQQP